MTGPQQLMTRMTWSSTHTRKHIAEPPLVLDAFLVDTRLGREWLDFLLIQSVHMHRAVADLDVAILVFMGQSMLEPVCIITGLQENGR